MTLDDKHYTLLKGTERFTVDGETETYTFYQVLQRHYKDIFKSKATKIECSNESLYQLANAARFRVFRAVQMHFDKPPLLKDSQVLLEAAEAITNSMEDNLTLPSQLSYAKWATKQDPHTALSLIAYYGWARSTIKQNIEEFAIYKMTLLSSGILIDIEYTHSFQDRLNAACQAALQEKLNNDRLTRHNDFATLQQIAISKFFFYQNRYVSASPGFNTLIKTTIQQYIIKLLDTRANEGYDVPFPQIDEPQNLMIPQTIELTWDQFDFVKTTNAQHQQREDNNKEKCRLSLEEKFADFPRDVRLTVAELGHPHRRVLIAAEKYGFIERPARGIVVLKSQEKGGF